jgi:hypothetical protein
MRRQRGRHVRAAMVSIVALLALATGCAGPSASASVVGDSPSALPALRDLVGTWHGYYGNLVIGNSYGDEGDCTLQIKDDATFTAKCAPVAWGANNLAKVSSWSGRVVTNGDRITLEKTDGGPWPWIVLTRWGNDTVYGVTLDPEPGVAATVEMKFERESASPAASGRN